MFPLVFQYLPAETVLSILSTNEKSGETDNIFPVSLQKQIVARRNTRAWTHCATCLRRAPGPEPISPTPLSTICVIAPDAITSCRYES